MKNKKGFTLVELLAVIAILAILVIIALPNVLGMFNTAKKNSFTNELKIIISAAEKEFIKDTTFNNSGTGNIVYSRINKNYCNRKLDLSGRSNLDFYLELDNRGRVVRYFASDGTYQYASEKNNLKATDIKVEDVGEAGVDGEVLVITCEAPEYRPDGTITTLISGKELNIRMKTLAGDSNPTSDTVNTNITGIVKSNTEPSEANKQAINLISLEGSKSPVYMWYESGIIKYYSEDDTIYLNRDSSHLFSKLVSMSNISALENFNTSHVRNFERTFYGCSGIRSFDPLTNWNVSNVTNMAVMLAGYSEYPMQITDLTPLRNWNTSKVTTMRAMFQDNHRLTKLDGLENWNVSNVTDMQKMFLGSRDIPMHLKDIKALRNWNTGNVTNLSGMFQENIDLENLEGLENWNVSNVTDMQKMFLGYDENLMHIKSLKPLTNWNTGNVTNLSAMFQKNIDLESTEGIENWNTANVEDFTSMFRGCISLKIANLSNFDMSKAKYYPGRKNEDGISSENGANIFPSNIGLEKVITPKTYPVDSNIFINLPKKMYDHEGNEYTRLDYTTPKNIELTSTRP